MPLYKPNTPIPNVPHPLLTPKEVIKGLTPHLRPERRKRIEDVLKQRLATMTVVLEHPYDPHNGAAMLRTAEALGLLNVHIIAKDGFSFSRKVTIDAHKWLNVYIHNDTTRCLNQLKEEGYRLWAALPPALKSQRNKPLSVDISKPTALVFGNEHAGLTQEAIDCCDAPFALPMFGFTESFNLSVSVALTLQPLVEKRRAHLGRLGDITGESYDRLKAAYYARACRHSMSLLMHHIRG